MLQPQRSAYHAVLASPQIKALSSSGAHSRNGGSGHMAPQPRHRCLSQTKSSEGRGGCLRSLHGRRITRACVVTRAQFAAGGMKLRVRIGGVGQHIGVTASTSDPPWRGTGHRGRQHRRVLRRCGRFRREVSSRRNAVSTSSDIVRP
jgi:hypothetical protein